jgi:glucosamine-6-phosphate deaminase
MCCRWSSWTTSVGNSRSTTSASRAFDDVPRQALTVTVPVLLSARKIFCMAPGQAKRDAVRRALREPLTADVPANALRKHADCTIYVDSESTPDEGA